MFKIGDEVRLVKGWTRLVVIGFTDSGQVIAKYDHDGLPQESRITNWNFDNPNDSYNTQKRSPSSFTYWDGAPATKVYYKMTKTYEISNGTYSGLKGTFLSTTSKGDVVLELSNGQVRSFPKDFLNEMVPFTFTVKSTSNNYTTTYQAPSGANINVGDVLVSSSGYIYVVTEVDTKRPTSKGEFVGYRLVQEAL